MKAQDGSDRYTTEIVASEMQMLDGRGDNAGMGNNMGGAGMGAAAMAGGFDQTPQYNNAPAQGGYNQGGGGYQQNRAPQQPSHNAPPQQPAGFDSFDDDIPF